MHTATAKPKLGGLAPFRPSEGQGGTEYLQHASVSSATRSQSARRSRARPSSSGVYRGSARLRSQASSGHGAYGRADGVRKHMTGPIFAGRSEPRRDTWDGPSPASYALGSTLERTGGAWSKGSRGDTGVTSTPGPAYLPSPVGGGGPSFGTGVRASPEGSMSPGRGAYGAPDGVGARVKGGHMGGRPVDAPTTDGPGAASYVLGSTLTGPAAGMGTGERLPQSASDGPGPGAYNASWPHNGSNFLSFGVLVGRLPRFDVRVHGVQPNRESHFVGSAGSAMNAAKSQRPHTSLSAREQDEVAALHTMVGPWGEIARSNGPRAVDGRSSNTRRATRPATINSAVHTQQPNAPLHIRPVVGWPFSRESHMSSVAGPAAAAGHRSPAAAIHQAPRFLRERLRDARASSPSSKPLASLQSLPSGTYHRSAAHATAAAAADHTSCVPSPQHGLSRLVLQAAEHCSSHLAVT